MSLYVRVEYKNRLHVYKAGLKGPRSHYDTIAETVRSQVQQMARKTAELSHALHKRQVQVKREEAKVKADKKEAAKLVQAAKREKAHTHRALALVGIRTRGECARARATLCVCSCACMYR